MEKEKWVIVDQNWSLAAGPYFEKVNRCPFGIGSCLPRGYQCVTQKAYEKECSNRKKRGY